MTKTNLAQTLLIVLALALGASGQSLYETFNDVPILDTNGVTQVYANGDTSIEPASVDFCSSWLDSSCANIIEIDVATSANTALELAAIGSGAFEHTLLNYDFIPLTSITTSNGYVMTPYLFLDLAVQGDMPFGTAVSMVQQLTMDLEFKLTPTGALDITPPIPQLDFQFGEPSLLSSTNASVTAEIVAGVYVDIWTADGTPLGGPMLAVSGSTTATIEPTQNPWWTVDTNFVAASAWNIYGVGLVGTQLLYDVTVPLDAADGPINSLDQGALTRWARTLASDQGHAQATCVASNGQGGFILGGNGAGILNRRMLVELDDDGTVLHEDLGNTAHSARPKSIVATADGGVAEAGDRLTTGQGYVARYDSARSLLWRYDYSGTVIESVTETAAGNLLVAGKNGANPWIVQLDGSGNEVWSVEYSVPGILSDAFETADGSIVAVGTVDWSDTGSIVTSTVNAGNAFIMKLDSTGALLWSRLVGNNNDGNINAACEAPNGDVVVVGHAKFETHAAWAARYATDGTLEWMWTYSGQAQGSGTTDPGSTPFDYLTDVEATTAGFVITGVTSLGVNRNALLFKIDDRGRIIWFKSLGGAAADVLEDVEVLDGDNLIAVGYTRSFSVAAGANVDEALVLRTSVDGQLHFPAQMGVNVFNAHNDVIDVAELTTYSEHDPAGTISTATTTRSLGSLAGIDPDFTLTLVSY